MMMDKGSSRKFVIVEMAYEAIKESETGDTFEVNKRGSIVFKRTGLPIESLLYVLPASLPLEKGDDEKNFYDLYSKEEIEATFNFLFHFFYVKRSGL